MQIEYVEVGPRPRRVPMDEYQEEWLEHRAAEEDPLEPADDATEL